MIVLVTDDLSMEALSGSMAERAQAALAAGCDLVLHCNGKDYEMVEVAAAVGNLPPESTRRLERAAAPLSAAPARLEAEERQAMKAGLDALLAVA